MRNRISYQHFQQWTLYTIFINISLLFIAQLMNRVVHRGNRARTCASSLQLRSFIHTKPRPHLCLGSPSRGFEFCKPSVKVGLEKLKPLRGWEGGGCGEFLKKKE
jgi:hypothetical protein